MGGLLKNTYNSFTLEKGVEKNIASGTGVYYVSNAYLDSVSALVVVDYDNAFVLGDEYQVEYRVESSVLYATAKISNHDIRVRTIHKK